MVKTMYKEICDAVCDIARTAGEYIAHERSVFSASDVQHKGGAMSSDLVSYVDRGAERLIVDALRGVSAEFLNSSVVYIAEEGTCVSGECSVGDGGTNIADGVDGCVSDFDSGLGSRYAWVIDPLDGTTNFVHGMPPYAVSIALVECAGCGVSGRVAAVGGDNSGVDSSFRDGRVVVGVIYEVKGAECFSAYAGGVAMLNGEAISCSGVDRLSDSLVISGLAHGVTGGEIDDFVRLFDHFNRTTHGARRLGSAATDLAYVASGRAEAFYQANLSPWDVAAGALIVACAGGRVTDFAGGGNYVFGRQIIATNARIYGDFVEQLKK